MTMHPPPKRERAHSNAASPDTDSAKHVDSDEEQPAVEPRDGLTEKLHKEPEDDSPKLPQPPEGSEKHPFEGTFDF